MQLQTETHCRARKLRLAAGVSAQSLAALLLFGAAPALAQTADQPAEPAATAEQQDGESEIIVTGYAASLQSAVSQKKAIDQIVESITAEDIGRLPDASIAESIARLPGLTSQRLNGRSNSISIRGFAPDFSTTLLNGREQTSTGDNRAVEYDQYPAEIINQVLVYKTPMASVVGQGLSGTVDLRTIRPLDFGKQVISIGGRGTYTDTGKLNAGSKEYGYRANGVYVDQFANDTIGIALAASYTDEPYQLIETEVWGYPGSYNAANPLFIGGYKPFVTSTSLKRLGLQGTIQFRPAPEWTTTVDGFFSDFKDDQTKRGIELPLGFSPAVLSNRTVENGLVTSGTFSGVEAVVNNHIFRRRAKLYAFGLNQRYDGDDGWHFMIDVSLSRTERNELTVESNAGTARGSGTGATDVLQFTTGTRGTVFRPTLNYGDYSLIKLTSPQGWGGTQIAPDGTSILNGQDGYYNDRIVLDDLKQYRVEVEKELDGFFSSIQFGLNYTDRLKSLTPDEYFLGLVANTDGRTDVVVPEQYRKGLSDLSAFGLGQVISYDPLELLNAGIYKRVRNAYGDVAVKAYRITEKQMTGYLQANIKQEIGASTLTGNVGVQIISTDQNSTGGLAIQQGNLPNGAPNIVANRRTVSIDYLDVLPSLNLSLRLPSDFVIRLGAAREIIRPRLDDMKASLSYSYQIASGPSGTFATVSGDSGNPFLRPWRANAIDFTVEKYFGSSAYIAIQAFYKDLKSYIYTQSQPFDVSSIAVPPAGTDPQGRPIVINPVGVVNVPINGKGGELYGVEFAATIPFGPIIPFLDGFGVTGSGSYTKSKVKPSPNEPTSALPGYSKWVVNGTAFFEKWGFNVRGSVRYRSSFIGEISGFGANRARRRALGETIVDAQVGYDFQEGSALHGLSLFLQGQNLTDEPFIALEPINTASGQVYDDRVVKNFQRYGRRFMAGFNYKF